MSLPWSEYEHRARAFAERWRDGRDERRQSQSFWNDFFAIFGIDAKTAATYELRVEDEYRFGWIDVIIPGKIIIEQKSAGRDLFEAERQTIGYFDRLSEIERPEYLLTCDFQRFHLRHLESQRLYQFTLPELPRHITLFAFLLPDRPELLRNQKPANEKAAGLLGRLHEQLRADGYTGHDLERLLVRLLFIFFADHTGIFTQNQFYRLMAAQTRPDGSNVGPLLTQLFDVLNSPEDRRQGGLSDQLRAFRYINGRLFEERIATPVFTREMRETLFAIAAFRWDQVSPAIFGGMFESVIDAVTQRQQGAHYTPEECIQRVIGPLFLDELQAAFATARALPPSQRDGALRKLHDRLAAMRLLDPACGAGNFLVIAYRELRELERLIIVERHAAQPLNLPVESIARIDVDHCYGIELSKFPALIAETALWMADHIANQRLAASMGDPFERLPLKATPGIRHADALEIDWNTVLPAAECTHVLGNPPFIGSKYQSPAQRAQVRAIARLGGSGGTLDYVTAWFIKAAEYVRGGFLPGTGRGTVRSTVEGPRIGFVATNSICQGEQVAQLWPILFGRCAVEIAFAHRTFVWPGRAAVHCVIVGLAPRGDEPTEKRLFSYPDPRGEPVESRHRWLTAYLFDAGSADRHGVVEEANRPINSAPPLVIGSKPIDGGYMIFSEAERARHLAAEPDAEPFIRPYVGSEEFINGGNRWIMAVQDAPPDRLAKLPLLRERVRQVRRFRLGELPRRRSADDPEARLHTPGLSMRALAATPMAWHVTVIPDGPFLVIPEVSSERRDYVPIDWLEPPTIPSNLVRVLLNATPYHFAILTSAMHMAWLRHIGGRLEMRYRYSIGLVYNTFPWPPEPSAQARAQVEALAQAVLDARARYPTSTLAQLYDPDYMKADLRRAHDALDRAVDKIYRPKGFATERERVEHLFTLYETLVQPTAAAPAANRRTARRAARRRSG